MLLNENDLKDFKELKVEDNVIFYNYLNLINELKDKAIISDWHISSLIFYKEIPKFKYKIINNFLILIGKIFNEHGFYLYQPFGKYDFDTFENLIEKIFEILNVSTIKFCFVSYEIIKFFLYLKKKYNINIKYLRNESDYIYFIKNFKNCIKKNKIRRLKLEYNISYEFINSNNKNICLEINKNYWCEKNKCFGNCTYCSSYFLKNIIKNYEKLNFFGIIIKNKEKYLGFMIASKINDMVIIHEIKYSHIKGINYYILNILLKILDKNVKLINFESDDGISNLRRYKKHLCKNYKFINKYYVEISKKL